METWIRERILQRYILENHSKFRINNKKIISVRDNKDQFPDLFCLLENKKEVPAEVEWKSSNFIQHGHDINLLKQNDGFLFVCEIDQRLGFKIPQVKINLNDFEKWFEKNSLKIIRDTTAPYKKIQKRKFPNLWFTYLSTRASGESDFQKALKHKTWGVQKNYSAFVINNISSMQKNDLIAFIGPGKKFTPRGRVPLKVWKAKSFKGYLENVLVFRVTSDYFYDEKTIIWKGKGRWQNEVFPHRFKFSEKPILNLKNVRINELSVTAMEELHSMVYSNFVSADPATLVDIIFHSE